MGPGPPVPGAGPGMGPGTPSGRMVSSPAAQNHMYRSPMPGPGYPVSYLTSLLGDAELAGRTKPPSPALCHGQLIISRVVGYKALNNPK